ncbi:hypothetical protein EGW08_010943 [Elysia chlorotica]|uniref:Helicase POLQ-like n=1 Tax=Elysia chlorotica TaxID=188477 RepID=A0A433TIF4_ELYCH|nr:hypothetical protein EGW08_010943 [Elysia chlorotica]
MDSMSEGQEANLACRRSRSSGKRKFSCTTASKLPSSKYDNDRGTVQIGRNDSLTQVGNSFFDFSTLDDSDLMLAALDDNGFITRETNALEGGEDSVKDACNEDVNSLDNSLSDIFFRSFVKDKENPQSKDLPSTNPVAVEDDCGSTEVEDPSQAETLITSTPRKKTDVNQSEPPVKCSFLKGRLKKRLETNVGLVPPHRTIEDAIRREAIEQAQLEASQIRREGTAVDIGPFYGLPLKVQKLLEASRGISKLYDWQEECLQLDALKDKKNLIYSLPTSGGKTLVAEILMMRQVLCHKRDAILVLPFVSIVQEKVRSITEFATELGFLVEEYAGSKGRFPPTKRREKKSLYIATIEKAHSLVNSLIELGRTEALGLVVVDELHMIGEGGSRGSNLEALLLKIVALGSDIQIVGMSATLNNIDELQQFLHAEIYSNNFRPVPLKEFVKVEDNIFHVNHQTLRAEDRLEHDKFVTFPYSSELLRLDPDHLLALVLEVAPDKSCLVFCPSKRNCESVSVMLSKLMASHHSYLRDINKSKRRQLLEELGRDGGGQICPVLARTVQFGVAYHHSGLTMDERRLIEDAYSDGTLCVLTCTSTLAAGVNLPAKRVILRSPYVGLSLIKHSQYKQMVGRAGRAGIDSSGESYLIVSSQDRMKVKEMLSGPQDFCHSSLMYDGGKGVKSLLLSAIGLKMVTSVPQAFSLMNQSLLAIQARKLGVDVETVTTDAVEYLLGQGLVTRGVECEGQLLVSPVGQATFKGPVDHMYSGQLYRDLKASESSLNLSTYLHLLYLVTPYDTALDIKPAFDIYFKKYCSLSETETKVAAAIGVPENYLSLRAGGLSSRKKVCLLTVNRFYLTLMLWDLWKEHTVWQVAETFSQTRGFIQNLLSQAAAFASCVLHYCEELEEFWAYQVLLEKFVKRLAHCVTSELLPLMDVPGVKLARAKQLYSAGYRSVSQLAAATEDQLSSCVAHLSRRAASQIVSAAKNILEERKAALMEEVDSLNVLDSSIGALY